MLSLYFIGYEGNGDIVNVESLMLQKFHSPDPDDLLNEEFATIVDEGKKNILFFSYSIQNSVQLLSSNYLMNSPPAAGQDLVESYLVDRCQPEELRTNTG